MNDKAAGPDRLGGSVDMHAVTAHLYRNNSQMAIKPDDGSYAVAVIATRFRLTLPRAKVVCTLARIGGSR